VRFIRAGSLERSIGQEEGPIKEPPSLHDRQVALEPEIAADGAGASAAPVLSSNGAHARQVAEELGTTPEDVAAAEAEAPAMAGKVEEMAEDRSWLIHRLRDPRTLLSFGLAIALFLFILSRFNLDPAEVWQSM
jgi:hypothetical protein